VEQIKAVADPAEEACEEIDKEAAGVNGKGKNEENESHGKLNALGKKQARAARDRGDQNDPPGEKEGGTVASGVKLSWERAPDKEGEDAAGEDGELAREPADGEKLRGFRMRRSEEMEMISRKTERAHADFGDRKTCNQKEEGSLPGFYENEKQRSQEIEGALYCKRPSARYDCVDCAGMPAVLKHRGEQILTEPRRKRGVAYFASWKKCIE